MQEEIGKLNIFRTEYEGKINEAKSKAINLK